LADKSHTAFLPTNFSYKPISNKNNKNNSNSLNKTAKLNQISVGNQTTSQTLLYQQHLTSKKKQARPTYQTYQIKQKTDKQCSKTEKRKKTGKEQKSEQIY
jgi:hypothetical protein